MLMKRSKRSGYKEDKKALQKGICRVPFKARAEKEQEQQEQG